MATERKTIVPTERELKPATIALITRAQTSYEADHKLKISQAIKKHKTAVFWALLLSIALVMEGYDVVVVSTTPPLVSTFFSRHEHLLRRLNITDACQINSFFGQTQFRERFGTGIDPKTRQKVITAPWQSGLANSALVGELAGLVINQYANDRFGCRRTMMFFMAWLAASIFISFFAPSLPVLAFGEAMCGISWGVFQVCYLLSHVPLLLSNTSLSRLSQLPTHVRLSLLSSDLSSPHGFVCAGAPAFCFPLGSFVARPICEATWAGDFHLLCNGSGLFRYLSLRTMLPSRHGTVFDEARSMRRNVV